MDNCIINGLKGHSGGTERTGVIGEDIQMRSNLNWPLKGGRKSKIR